MVGKYRRNVITLKDNIRLGFQDIYQPCLCIQLQKWCEKSLLTSEPKIPNIKPKSNQHWDWRASPGIWYAGWSLLSSSPPCSVSQWRIQGCKNGNKPKVGIIFFWNNHIHSSQPEFQTCKCVFNSLMVFEVCQCVHFLQLCLYNIPYLTPTKIFWVHKLTYFFFIDVFHGIFVPLKMEVPWDLNKPAPEGFYVGRGQSGTLKPRRCQDEVETTKFLAQGFKRDEGRKIRKRKPLDNRKIQPEYQSEQSPKSITIVAEFSRNVGKEETSNGRLEMSQSNLRQSYHQENDVTNHEDWCLSKDHQQSANPSPSSSLLKETPPAEQDNILRKDKRVTLLKSKHSKPPSPAPYPSFSGAPTPTISGAPKPTISGAPTPTKNNPQPISSFFPHPPPPGDDDFEWWRWRQWWW